MFVESKSVVFEKSTTLMQCVISFLLSCQCMTLIVHQRMSSSVAKDVQILGLSLIEVISESMSRQNSKEKAKNEI